MNYWRSKDSLTWIKRILELFQSVLEEWRAGLWLCVEYSGYGAPKAILCAKDVEQAIWAGVQKAVKDS